MPNKKVVDSTGHELHPGLVVRWLLKGSSFEGEVRVILKTGELTCTGGHWRTWNNVLGFT